MTSGEGGLALTNDSRLADAMAMLRTHGVTRDAERFRGGIDESALQPTPAVWYYEQHLLGFNYRMTDIHAALGTSQLDRLDRYVDRRNELAGRYNQALRDLTLQLPAIELGNRSAFHLYVVRLKSSAKSQRQLFDELRQQGVGVALHYLPVHLQPYYRERGFSLGQYPEAEAHAREALTLPLYAALSNAMQDRVVETLHQILKR